MTRQLPLSLRGEREVRALVQECFVCIPFDRSIRGSMDLAYARETIFMSARAHAAAALTIRVAIINYATLERK